MPDLRLNLITREWVVVENDQIITPDDFIEKNILKKQPNYSPTCHFCAGNEDMLPDEVDRIEEDGKWKVRVVRNKFSRLSEEGDNIRWNDKLKRGANGVGIHEIIVETPYHNLTTATTPLEQIKAVIEMYKKRFVKIYEDPRVEHVVIFKNSGRTAGTSFEHSLSQIAGIPVTPLEVRDRTESYLRFFDDTGECLMCRMLGEEIEEGSRIVLDSGHFVSFVPYAAMSPFHLWIFPKRHAASIADIAGEEIIDLASNMKTIMSKLYFGLENPDFNYTIRAAKPTNAGSKFMHWYLSLVPRIGYLSGFEMACGMHINPIQPEISAEYLRSVGLPEQQP